MRAARIACAIALSRRLVASLFDALAIAPASIDDTTRSASRNRSAGSYVDGSTHTNTIEGFFGNLKTGIRGNYKKVSRKWLQGYLNEFVWRYNHRHTPDSMFRALLLRAARS